MAGMSDAADMAKMGNMANMNQRTQVQQSLFVSPSPSYFRVYQCRTPPYVIFTPA